MSTPPRLRPKKRRYYALVLFVVMGILGLILRNNQSTVVPRSEGKMRSNLESPRKNKHGTNQLLMPLRGGVESRQSDDPEAAFVEPAPLGDPKKVVKEPFDELLDKLRFKLKQAAPL